MAAGYMLVAKSSADMDEILAGVGLLIWIVVDVITESMFGGANPDQVTIWSNPRRFDIGADRGLRHCAQPKPR